MDSDKQREFLESGLYNQPDRSPTTFGWYQICETTFRHIREILPDGKRILELGSGWGTTQLARYYKVSTVEEDPQWLNRHPSVEYIHAPIDSKTGWYDVAILKGRLPQEYDFIIVDGPSHAFETGRRGFL